MGGVSRSHLRHTQKTENESLTNGACMCYHYSHEWPSLEYASNLARANTAAPCPSLGFNTRIRRKSVKRISRSMAAVAVHVLFLLFMRTASHLSRRMDRGKSVMALSSTHSVSSVPTFSVRWAQPETIPCTGEWKEDTAGEHFSGGTQEVLLEQLG